MKRILDNLKGTVLALTLYLFTFFKVFFFYSSNTKCFIIMRLGYIKDLFVFFSNITVKLDT